MKRMSRALSLLLGFCLLLPLLFGLFSCSSEPASENRVTSVVLEKGTVRVEAELTEGFLNGYTEKKVYLFELPSHHSSGSDLSELDPVAEAKPRSSLSFELDAVDGVRSRLFSSYLVAAYDSATRGYTPLTAPVSLSNPEAAASYTPPAATGEASIKGLISDYPADALRLGVSHTVVEVPMEELILSDWQENAVSYVFGGVTRYVDAEALERLDETVGVYTAAGIQVYLRFVLGSTRKENAPLGLYVPTDAMLHTAADYAVDMSTAFAAGIMEGFLDFMADRYASPDDGSAPVSAFIMGYRVNDACLHNYMGETSLAAYVTNYEKLVRVAHTAIKSHNPEGRVYVSLDSRRTVGAEGKGWDVTAFLAAFREECALRGDYGWHVACELYADTAALWEENPAADTGDDADKDQEEGGKGRRDAVSGLDSNDRKGGKADGIHEKERPVVSFPVAGEIPAYSWDAENSRSSCRKNRIAWVAEDGRRGDAEDKVPDDSAADGDDDGKDEDAEEVHLFGDAGKRSGRGKGDGPQELKKQEEEGHAVAWSGQDYIALVSGRIFAKILTIVPTRRAAMTVPSRTPTRAWRKTRQSTAAMRIWVVSETTRTPPKDLPVTCDKTWTNPSPGRMSRDAETQRYAPSAITTQPRRTVRILSG